MINLGNLDEALTVSEKHNVVLKEDWAKKTNSRSSKRQQG